MYGWAWMGTRVQTDQDGPGWLDVGPRRLWPTSFQPRAASKAESPVGHDLDQAKHNPAGPWGDQATRRPHILVASCSALCALRYHQQKRLVV